jgi:putative tryptophan/tyrosine transport system substrate-binding protein
MIHRREFITLLGGAVLWPTVANAEQPERRRRIAYLHGLAESDPEAQARIIAFRQSLAVLGWIEGSNISIDHHFASGDPARAQTIAADVVGSAPATQTIPIVFMANGDPVAAGLVASLNQPGGNATGVTIFGMLAVGKRLELLAANAQGWHHRLSDEPEQSKPRN